MNLSCEEVDQEAPMPTNPTVTLFVVVAIFICIFTLIGYNRGWFDSEQTRQEKLWTRAMREDYDWLKIRATELEKEQIVIMVNEDKHITGIMAIPDKLTDLGYKADVVIMPGYKVIFNRRAAEYNERMARWDWRFTETYGLPKGADKPLPRKFELYTIPGEK